MRFDKTIRLINSRSRRADIGAMGVRSRHQGRRRQAEGGPRCAPRGRVRHRSLESTPGHRPRHAVVTDNPRRPDRRDAMARRLLPGMRDEPGDRSPLRRPSPPGLGGNDGARPAMLPVSLLGADAEAAGLARVAAREPRPGRDRLTQVQLGVVPTIPKARYATRCPASRFMDAAQWLVLAA